MKIAAITATRPTDFDTTARQPEGVAVVIVDLLCHTGRRYDALAIEGR